MLTSTTAERIQAAMKMKKMKQADIIKKTGISKAALSCYVSGKYLPKQNNIYLIARALNVNEAWLMGYDVPMERVEVQQNESAEELLRLYNKSTPEIQKVALAVLKAGQQNDD